MFRPGYERGSRTKVQAIDLYRGVLIPKDVKSPFTYMWHMFAISVLRGFLK